MSGAAMDRRLALGTRQWNSYKHSVGLRTTVIDIGRAISITRHVSTRRKGCMGGRNYTTGASWCHNRHNTVSLFHNGGKARKPTRKSGKALADRSNSMSMGSREQLANIHRKSNFTASTGSSSPVLHTGYIRRYQNHSKTEREISGAMCPSEQLEPSGLKSLENPVYRGWKTDIRRRGDLESAYGRSRCWIRRYTRCGYASWLRRRVTHTRNMDTAITSQVNCFQGASGDSADIGERPSPSETPGVPWPDPSTRRQHGGLPHCEQYGLRQPSSNGRTAETARIAGRDEDHNTSSMAPIGTQQARGQTQPSVGPERSSSNSLSDRLIGFLAETTRGSSVLGSQGRPSSSGEGPAVPNVGILGRRNGPSMAPTSATDPDNSPQNREREGTRSGDSPALERSTLVQSIAQTLPRVTSHSTRRSQTLRLRIRQPGMGARGGSSRADARQAAIDSIASRVPATEGGRESLRLAKSVLSSTTASTKTSQWRKFERFCETEGHDRLPANMETVLGYIGFLFEEDRVHSASLDHYISAIRTRHLREGYPDPCTGQHQKDLIRAFKREDDARGVLSDVRAAIPANVIARIRDYGLTQPIGSIGERNAAIIDFNFSSPGESPQEELFKFKTSICSL